MKWCGSAGGGIGSAVDFFLRLKKEECFSRRGGVIGLALDAVVICRSSETAIEAI